jgi:hypothetical protein
VHNIFFNGYNNGAHSTFWNGSDTPFSVGTFNDNAWNCICVSFDDVSGTLIYSVNGTNDTRSQHHNSPSSSDATATLNIGAIGAGEAPEQVGDRFATVAIWDRALSSAELLSFYNITKGRFGL